jgi:hypothetical protein
MYLNLFQIERHFHSINAAVRTNSTFSPCIDIQEFYELTLLDETKTVQQKTAETLQMASKWETANQQSGPAAVIIPTRFGDSIQQQSSSCVTAASTSSSFPMEVRTQYNLPLNLFATVAGVGGVYKKPKEKPPLSFLMKRCGKRNLANP